MFSGLATMDLVLIDPATYVVRYRMEPRSAGAYGLFWYGEGGAYSANVDSTAASIRGELELDRPVFSVPTLPWVLSQLASRVDDPVRLELPGFGADGEGSLDAAVLRPGPRGEWKVPGREGTRPSREMRLELESGSSWTYHVSTEPPYFLAILARDGEGAVTSRVEVVDWATPELDPARRFPLLRRQSFLASRPAAGPARVVTDVPDEAVEAPGPPHPLMEPRPAVHPEDPDLQLVAAITRGSDGVPWHCMVYRTDDGGGSWSRHDFREMERCIDPWAAFLPGGTALVSATDIRSDAEGDERFQLLAWRSEDGGASWTGPTDLGRTHEHAMLAPGPDGSLYLASRVTTPTAQGTLRHAVHLARSDDGGRTFTERFRLVPGVRSVMPTGVVPLEEGRVALSYRGSNRNMASGQEEDAPATSAWLLAVDGAGEGALTHRLIHDGCSTGALEGAFPGYPQMAGTSDGRLYHACVRPGLQGVALSRSHNGGRSWSRAVRVDGLTDAEDAHVRTPMVAVGPDGTVGVGWYDRRHDPDRACQDVYFTASADGGETFTEPLRVTTQTSCPGAEGNGSAGSS
ncbi:MAG TPA: sialidase family protein, partial [Longimicrobiales bacterium]|nr:sialidase family protein [Longimicrobiales bacterium]